jgi:hypothetical protein
MDESKYARMPDVKILRGGWTFISIVKARFKVSQNLEV